MDPECFSNYLTWLLERNRNRNRESWQLSEFNGGFNFYNQSTITVKSEEGLNIHIHNHIHIHCRFEFWVRAKLKQITPANLTRAERNKKCKRVAASSESRMQILEARYRFWRGVTTTYRSRGELYVCSMQYQFPQSPQRLLFGNAFENWWRCKAAAASSSPFPIPYTLSLHSYSFGWWLEDLDMHMSLMGSIWVRESRTKIKKQLRNLKK